MGKVIVRIHKCTADAQPYWRVLIDEKLYCTENSKADGDKMVAKLKADPEHKGKTITSVEASTTAGAGIKTNPPRKLFGDARDAKPATDSERRERIQRVMQGAGVTEATARNMLEGEEWDVIDAVRELKHMRTLGFVIDAKPTYDAANSAKEDEIDQQIRAKVKQLGGHVSVQVPGLHRKPVQEELLKLAEKYKKLTGQMHRSFENYYG